MNSVKKISIRELTVVELNSVTGGVVVSAPPSDGNLPFCPPPRPHGPVLS